MLSFSSNIFYGGNCLVGCFFFFLNSIIAFYFILDFCGFGGAAEKAQENESTRNKVFFS